MIKAPGSHADRIAQACDRCRSKKIRCDGKRPNCSQCATVGFECKTTDKLSRRAFPRGYTESLEDRVRQLESDNTKLQSLLDIKDEQMEMLSKFEGSRRKSSTSPEPIVQKTVQPAKPPATTPTPAPASSIQTPITPIATPAKSPALHEEEEEPYFVHQPNTLASNGSYYGASTGHIFTHAFVEKLNLRQSPVAPLVSKLMESLETTDSSATKSEAKAPSKPSVSHSPPFESLPTPASIASPVSPMPRHFSTPPFFSTFAVPNRMTTDKLTTSFFHEWNTMFAIVDQNAFLEQYQSVMNAMSTAETTGFYDIPGLRNEETSIVLVLLVLTLGALVTKDKTPAAMAEAAKLAQDWKRTFSIQLQTKPSLATLQALLLAQLCSLHLGNVDDVWHFRVMAINMCQRLGLQCTSQSIKTADGKPLSFYELEMRRRLFWATYSLDCFASVTLGVPRLINDNDVECALPLNIDDLEQHSNEKPAAEYGSAMACPLAVIGFSKCLARILDTIYSSTTKSHPYKTLVMLEDQLESWRRDLSADLKFEFQNGAPVVALAPVHQKSPLLLMFYHLGRILIHMPAVTSPATAPASADANANANARGSASCVAVLQSAKVQLQLQNYLKARNVVPTVPLNPARFTVLVTTLVLYGAIDYSKGGALLLDIKNVVSGTLAHLYSDLQIHRVGSLPVESFTWMEEICDTLLNASNSKKSGDDEKRKRRQSTKRHESISSAAPVAIVTKPPVAQQPTPPPVPSETIGSSDPDSLRYNAINDLLYLSTYASQKSQAQGKGSKLTPESEGSHGSLVDLFHSSFHTATAAHGPQHQILDHLISHGYNSGGVATPSSVTSSRISSGRQSPHSLGGGNYKSEMLNYLDNAGNHSSSWQDSLHWMTREH